MEIELNYLPVCVKQPERVIELMEQHLGFRKCEWNTLPIVSNANGDNYLLYPPADASESAFEAITLPTDNCLRDYVRLIHAGLNIETVPYYTSDGLKMDVCDEAGNKFSFIEKRNYAEYE
jgi:hypothetical protein